MTGEVLPDPQAELRARFDERLMFWADFFATTEEEDSKPVQNLAIAELDSMWYRLGNDEKEFVVSGYGTWGDFVDTDDSDESDIDQVTQVSIPDSDQSVFEHELPMIIRQYSGNIHGLKGESKGFQISTIEDGLAARLCYLFLKDEIIYSLGNNATATMSTYINCDVLGATLVEAATFDIMNSGSDDVKDDSDVVDAGDDVDEDDEGEDFDDAIIDAEDLEVVKYGAEIAATLSKASDDFLKYTRQRSFRRRSIAKQYELLARRINDIESLAQIFGQAAYVEAEYFLVNSGTNNTEPSYRTILAGEIQPIQGYCGGLVLPWMQDIYRNGIKRDDDWFYMAGGLCLAVLPFFDIYVPQTQEIIANDKNIFIPISGQEVQAHIYPIIS